MGRRLKVYGWTAIIRDPERAKLGMPQHMIQCRCIVAASSMAEVGRLVGRRAYQLFNLCETGNALEIEIALRQPRTFLARGLDRQSGYIPVPPEAVS